MSNQAKGTQLEATLNVTATYNAMLARAGAEFVAVMQNVSVTGRNVEAMKSDIAMATEAYESQKAMAKKYMEENMAIIARSKFD
jgi:hypothetical protein